MDECIVYYTEWNKPEKENQTSYSNASIWNVERWYWLTYLLGSNGDADMESRLMDMGRGKEGEGGTNEETSMEAYTLPYVK